MSNETRSNCSYLVCEYLEGIELSEYLKDCEKLDIPTAIHIARQICSGLAAAHTAGVMHRDVKPQNIFVLSKSGAAVATRPDVKILDFGLSRFMDSVGTQLTRDGVIMGTPAYMAPEQAGGGAVDFRTDIYGVGAVLYALVTGESPHRGETLQELLIAVMNEPPPRPSEINREIPANLELVIQRTMERNPDQRYQSMDELNQALAACEEAFAVSQVSQGSQIWPMSRFMSEGDAQTVKTARPRLVAWGVLSCVLLLIALSSVLPSIEVVTGKLRFTKVEVVLILSGLVGTLITPIVMFFRHVKNNVWSSHVRVLDHLKTIQSAIFWGLGAYGIAALTTRFMDDIVGRLGAAYLFGRGPGAGFRGWNAVFAVTALGVAGLAVAYRQQSKAATTRNKLLRQTLFAAGGGLLVLIGIALGLLWRLHVVRLEQAQLLALATTANASAREPSQELAPTAAAAEPEPAASTAPKVEPRAPADELARASAKGAQGLAPLAERYPRDPNVLKPLVFAFASRSTGLTDAMAIMQRLFDVAPEETRDSELRFLVRKAANVPGETSILAFSTMVEHMGSAGPDQLYEIMITNPRLYKHADELIASDDVQALATPALKVAYELRKAPNCAARLPMLDRAAELGDVRAVQILSPLTVGARHGCGPKKRSPCVAPCAAEAARYLEAIGRIMARQPRH